MKNKITLIGITEPMEVYEYTHIPNSQRRIKFVENPGSHKVMYPVLKPITINWEDSSSIDNFLTSNIESHELRNLLYYED